MARIKKIVLAVIFAELTLSAFSFLFGLFSASWSESLVFVFNIVMHWGGFVAILAITGMAYFFYREDLRTQGDGDLMNDNSIGKKLWIKKLNDGNTGIMGKVNQKKSQTILVTKDYYHF